MTTPVLAPLANPAPVASRGAISEPGPGATRGFLARATVAARRFAVALIGSGVAIAAAGCMTAASPGAVADPTVPAGDPTMAAAIQDARRTLPDFFAVAASPPAGTVGFRLRVSISDGSRREFLWVMPFQQRPDGRYAGTVAEAPAYLTGVEVGMPVDFDRSQIVDWGYTANGHDIGSRTVCVMLGRMPAEKADALRREHRMSC